MKTTSFLVCAALACLFATISLLAARPAQKDVQLKADDLLRFTPQQITAAPGEKLNLTLSNTGRIPSMRHNFVLLKDGVSPVIFGNQAMNAESDGYVPAALRGDVIAFTPLAAPGQSHAVSFSAPQKPGRYTFICSYPGHYSTSQGTLVVE